jgi:hypothetical protein
MKYRKYEVTNCKVSGSVDILPNKKMHVTLPALASFSIIARHNGLGAFFGLILPVRARAGHVILGVRPPLNDKSMGSE